MMTIRDTLHHAKLRLHQSDSPEVDSHYLLCHVLQCQSHYLQTWPEKKLTEQQHQDFERLLHRREQGEPVAYLIGERGFWTLDLKVDIATLIPRPDTEILVSTALSKMTAQMVVMDIGTGSGAIALALASERNDITVFASDQSAAALGVAQSNRRQHHLHHVFLWQGDWLDAIQAHCVDLIVSNPPYIDQNDPHLEQGDVRFEPKSALVAENKGLADIEQISRQASTRLKAGGWLMVEHGYQQALAVQALFQQHGFEQISSIRDYGGHERVTIGQLPV